jgi:hypothetical protein
MKNFFKNQFKKQQLKPSPRSTALVERQTIKNGIYLVNDKYVLQEGREGFLIKSMSGSAEYYMIRGYLINQEEVDTLLRNEEIEDRPHSLLFKIPFNKVGFIIGNSTEYCHDGEIRYYFDEELQKKWDNSQTGTEELLQP